MKKFLGILFIFSITFLFSAENIDFVIPVVNESEVKTLTDILNAVSMILYSNADNGALNYEALLKLVFTFGSFLVFTNIVFMASGQMNGLQSYVTYNAVVVGILSIIYSTKANVMITTKNISEPQTCTVESVVTTDFVVVPYVLGYGIKVMDSIGTSLTDMFETAMYQPEGELGTPAILDGGFGQNLKVIGQTLGFSPYDSQSTALMKNFQAFSQECIIKGLYSSEVDRPTVIGFYKSNNMYTYVQDNIMNGSTEVVNQMENIMVENHNGIYKSCKDLFTNDIAKTDLEDMTTNFLCRLEGNNPEGSLNYLMKETLNTQSAVYSNTKDMIIQAALLNSSRDAARTESLGITGVDFAVGKTKAEAVVNAIQGSNYMMEMLPYMTIVFKGLIYAVFPFILVLMILPGGGTIFKQYLKSVLWIQLWLPTAAILNYFIYGYTEERAKMTVGMDGLTFNSGADLLSSSASLAGVAGLLYLSIPAVSWLFLTGSAQMMGNLTGAVGQSVLKNSNSDAIAQDMKSVETQKSVNSLTGGDMGIAEAESYAARMSGVSMGAAIGANVMNGGLAQQAKREYFEASRKLKTTDKVMAAGINSDTASGADAAQQIENVNTAIAANKVDGKTGDVNIEQVSNSAAIKGSKEAGDIQSYLNKFDTNNDGILSEGEQKVLSKFQEDNQGLTMAQQQGKLNAVGGLDGKDGVSMDDLQKVENIEGGVENKNLINKQEDLDALKRMGERSLKAQGIDTSNMSDEDLMKAGATISAKVDASTSASQAEGVYNKVGGDMQKLEQIKGKMAQVGLANDAATINAVSSLANGDFNKGLKSFEAVKGTTQEASLKKDIETIKTANANYDGGYIQLQKDLGGKEALESGETLETIDKVASENGISRNEAIKRIAQVKTGKDFAESQGQLMKYGSVSNMVQSKIKQAITSERGKISDQKAIDNQLENMKKGGIGFIDNKSQEKLIGQQKELDKLNGQKTKLLDGKDINNLSEEDKKKLSSLNGQIAGKKEEMNQTVSDGLKTAEKRMLGRMADSSGSAISMVSYDENGNVRTARVDEEGLKQYAELTGTDVMTAAKTLSTFKDASAVAGIVGTLGARAAYRKFISGKGPGGKIDPKMAEKLKNMGTDKKLSKNVANFEKEMKKIDKLNVSDADKANLRNQAMNNLQKSNKDALSDLNKLKEKNQTRLDQLGKSGKTDTAEFKQLAKENREIRKFNQAANKSYSDAAKGQFKKSTNWSNMKNKAWNGVKGHGAKFLKTNLLGAAASVTVEQGMDAHRNAKSIDINAKDNYNKEAISNINNGNFENFNENPTRVRISSYGYLSDDSETYSVSFNANNKDKEITLTHNDGTKHQMSKESFSHLFNTKTSATTHLLNEFKGMEIGSDSLNDKDYDKTTKLSENRK